MNQDTHGPRLALSCARPVPRMLALLLLILCACGEASEVPKLSADDMFVVLVAADDGGRPAPLQGAVVGIAQDGKVVAAEADAEGRAVFEVDPDGGALTVSAYYPDHIAATFVGYDRPRLREGLEQDGVFLLALQPTRSEYIRVNGEVKRSESDIVLTVTANTAGPPSSEISDRFSVSARAGAPFILTAYEQIPEIPPAADTGMSTPVISWRTLEHAGSAKDVDVSGDPWTEHELVDHELSVVRPTTPPSFADDSALIRVDAAGGTVDAPDVMLPAAGLSLVAPWRAQDTYEVTLTGRADLMASDALVVIATLYDSKRRFSSVRTRQGLPTRIAASFLAPQEPSTARPSFAQPLTWAKDEGDGVWTFLIARDGFVNRWLVSVLPGTSSLDLPTLLATLPSSGLGTKALEAYLYLCDSDPVTSRCNRAAGGQIFEIEATP